MSILFSAPLLVGHAWVLVTLCLPKGLLFWGFGCCIPPKGSSGFAAPSLPSPSWPSWCPLISGLHLWIFSVSPACSEHQGWDNTLPCKISLQVLGAPSCSGAAAASWGRRGEMQWGLFSSAQLHRGPLRLPGMAALLQMEDEALGVSAVCCPKRPGDCFTQPLCRYPLNYTENNAPCHYPRRWVQMTPLLTCA